MHFTQILALVICLVFSSGVAVARTCDECRDIHKNKQNIQQDLLQKDAELNAAFKQNNFKAVNDLRAKMLELRKKMIELRGFDEECEQACRPDIVRASECKKLMDEILRLEATATEADYGKIDAMYKQFQTCNHDLERLKKSE